MAVLEIDVDTAAVSPVRRQRRVGALFICAVAWIVVIGLAAIFADVLPIPSPTDIDFLAKRAAPGTPNHLLGADHLGRDELSRLIYGGRVSLIVGLLAPVIGVLIGGSLGMLAGYFRGRLETFVVGGVDVLLAFPPLVFALAVTAYLGPSVLNITLVIGVLGRLTPELSALMAGSFHFVILPWKMFAMVVGSSFRLLTPDRLYDIVIGPSMIGKYSTVLPLKFATSSEGIGESEPANWTTPAARSERPLPEPPPIRPDEFEAFSHFVDDIDRQAFFAADHVYDRWQQFLSQVHAAAA